MRTKWAFICSHDNDRIYILKFKLLFSLLLSIAFNSLGSRYPMSSLYLKTQFSVLCKGMYVFGEKGEP